jgi:predicted nucleotidyltransferase
MNAKKIYTIDEIKQKLYSVAQKYNVERIYLFGSYARGEAKAKSDIDLRIDGDLNFGYIKYFGMCGDFQKKFRKRLDLITTDGLDNKFLKAIEKEEILVYGS